MNEAQKAYITKKLVDRQCAMDERTKDKNALVKTYNEVTRKDKAFISAYSVALATDSTEALEEILGEFEFAEFLGKK